MNRTREIPIRVHCLQYMCNFVNRFFLPSLENNGDNDGFLHLDYISVCAIKRAFLFGTVLQPYCAVGQAAGHSLVCALGTDDLPESVEHGTVREQFRTMVIHTISFQAAASIRGGHRAS